MSINLLRLVVVVRCEFLAKVNTPRLFIAYHLGNSVALRFFAVCTACAACINAFDIQVCSGIFSSAAAILA